jgi:peptide/nickel transport system ATP-binding protein
MSEDQPVIRVEGLRIQFSSASNPAVEDLSFSIETGKTLAIVGDSGSGKSVTAMTLMGLLPSHAEWSGRIGINSENAHFELDSSNESSDWVGLRGSVLSLVFQDLGNVLNPIMCVGRQIVEMIVAQGIESGSVARLMARDWLERVKLTDPDDIYDRYPHQLSEGQKQRVLIAMALSARPALLIADEPTSALDLTEQCEIFSLIRTLKAETGIALLLITQDLALVADLADDVLVLHKGAVQEYGPVAQVLKFPHSPYTKALLACRPTALRKGRRLPVPADFLEGIPPAPQTFPELKSGVPALLQVRQLRVWYSGKRKFFGPPSPVLRAVEDVSFDLLHGEVLGLIGESGSGKSTLSKALVGLQTVESGMIHFAGKDLTHLDVSGWKKMRRQIQIVFQDAHSSLSPRLTIGMQLREVLKAHSVVPASQRHEESRRLITMLELSEDVLEMYPHELNMGQLQRIGIARALAVRPELIICDDILSPLEVGEQAQILNLLKSLQMELKLSYLFISHDLNAVHYIADHILVMQEGRIVERGTAENVMRNPEHEYTKQLIAAMPHSLDANW